MSNAAPIMTARETARRVASHALTAEAAVQVSLAAIAAREPAVGAWQVLAGDAALAEARAFDKTAAHAETPLALGGIPIAVKDNIDTADLPTGYGSGIYEGHRPGADAACVALAKRAGAIVMGKTVSTEFAYFQPGKTANPHNVAHTTGGSSQGSAAAVAAGMVPVAFATQTAGSIIRPAAYCGVVGYKPSWGLIPRQGLKVLSDWLDTIGVITQDVADAAFFVAALTARPALVPSGEAGKLRVVVLRPPYPVEAEPEAVAALERAIAALRDGGHGVSDLPMPPMLQTMPRLQRIVMGYDMERSLAHERRVHESEISSILKNYLDEGRSISGRAYDSAMASVKEAQADMETVFGEADVILMPSAPGEAPHGLHATGDPAFNRGWTLLQLPAITIPAGFGPNALPVGVQLCARAGQDAMLLAAALTLETALAGVK